MWQLFDLGNLTVVMLHDPIILTSLQKKRARIISEGGYAVRTKGYDLIAGQERGAGFTVCVEWKGIVVFAFPSSDELA
jgi:hypothetical protein